MLTLTGGRFGSGTRGREQLRRFFGADLSFQSTACAGWTKVFTHPHADELRDPAFAKRSATETDAMLCDSLEFSEDFFEWCLKLGTLRDFDTAMQVLSMSSAFDLYAWLAERATLDRHEADRIAMYGLPKFSSCLAKKKESELLAAHLAHVLTCDPGLARHAELFCCPADRRFARERVGKPFSFRARYVKSTKTATD